MGDFSREAPMRRGNVTAGTDGFLDTMKVIVFELPLRFKGRTRSWATDTPCRLQEIPAKTEVCHLGIPARR